MRTTITIEHEIIEELLKETKARSKASAVKEVINDYLKRAKIEKIKSKKGRLAFDMTAERIRHDER